MQDSSTQQQSPTWAPLFTIRSFKMNVMNSKIFAYLSDRDGKVTTLKHITDNFKIKADEAKGRLVDLAATTGMTLFTDVVNMKSKDVLEFALPETAEQDEIQETLGTEGDLESALEDTLALADEAVTYGNELTDGSDNFYDEPQAEESADLLDTDADDTDDTAALDAKFAAYDGSEGEGNAIDMSETGTCAICGKLLSLHKSVVRGVGPVCLSKLAQFVEIDAEDLADEGITSQEQFLDYVASLITARQAVKEYASLEDAYLDYPEGIISLKDLFAVAQPMGIPVTRFMKQAGGDGGTGKVRNEAWRYFYVGRTRFVSQAAEQDLPEIAAEAAKRNKKNK
jgi:hypothetical protein